MPIDIKWIRNNPSAVEEWQRLRRKSSQQKTNNTTRSTSDTITTTTTTTPNYEDEDDSVVKDVIALDESCRKLLQQLNDRRTLLKKIQKSLRPKLIKGDPKNHNTENDHQQGENRTDTSDDLNEQQYEQQQQQQQSWIDAKQQERCEVETSIVQLQIDWTDASNRVEQALWKVASPVDVKVERILPRRCILSDKYPNSASTSSNGELPSTRTNHHPSSLSPTETIPGKDLSFLDTNLGLDISHALVQYTRHYFHQYPMVRLPAKAPILVQQQQQQQHSQEDHHGSYPIDDGNNNDDPYGVESKLAHAMWGCSEPSTNSVHNETNLQDDQEQHNRALYGCPICTAELLKIRTSSTAYPSLDAWVGLLARQRHDSSCGSNNNSKKKKPVKGRIFGAKQLPQYTGLWTNPLLQHGHPVRHRSMENFQIIALTAGRVYESRSIQGILLQEILDFYTSLSVTTSTQQEQKRQPQQQSADTSHTISDTIDSADHDTPTFQTRIVEPSQLELHELSRIVIEAIIDSRNSNDDNETGSKEVFTLGSVSNFGDAASRACGLQYSGGGGNTGGAAAVAASKANKMTNMKDYVHVVQGTFHLEGILQWMLSPRKRRHRQQEHETSRPINQQQTVNSLVAVPKSIVNYMVTATSHYLAMNEKVDYDMDDDGILWIPRDEVTSGYALSHMFGLVSTTDKHHKGKESQYQQEVKRKEIREIRESKTTHSANDKSDHQPKFPLTTVQSKTAKQTHLEALSCPYGFLFG